MRKITPPARERGVRLTDADRARLGALGAPQETLDGIVKSRKTRERGLHKRK